MSIVNGPDSPVRLLRKKPCQRPVTSRSTAVGAQPRLGSDSRAAAASANGSIRLVVTRGKETFILPSFLKAPSAGICRGPLIRALGGSSRRHYARASDGVKVGSKEGSERRRDVAEARRNRTYETPAKLDV